MPSQKIRHNGTWLDIPIVGPTNAAMQAAAEAAAGPAAAAAGPAAAAAVPGVLTPGGRYYGDTYTDPTTVP